MGGRHSEAVAGLQDVADVLRPGVPEVVFQASRQRFVDHEANEHQDEMYMPAYTAPGQEKGYARSPQRPPRQVRPARGDAKNRALGVLADTAPQMLRSAAVRTCLRLYAIAAAKKTTRKGTSDAYARSLPSLSPFT